MTPLDRDRGLNAVNARTFAHPDEDRAVRAVMGAPFPATTVGLFEAGWALVPILRSRSATALATAAEARLASILGLLDLRRLDAQAMRAYAELDRHRRAAHRNHVPVELAAAFVIGAALAAVGTAAVWLASMLGTAFAVGTLIALVIGAAMVFVILRAMTRAELVAGLVDVRGLRIPAWLAGLPPASAAAVQMFLDLPYELVPTVVPDRDLITIDDGAGTSAVVACGRFLDDVARTAPSTTDDVRDLLAGYLTGAGPGALVLRGALPAVPAWRRGPFDGWERLFDRFGAVSPITVRWTVRGGALFAALSGEYDEEPAAVMVADLVSLAEVCGAGRLPSADRAARAIADLLVNQLVHGDRVMFTRGGGPADRELLITALQGGDLDEAAVRSQWTGEH